MVEVGCEDANAKTVSKLTERMDQRKRVRPTGNADQDSRRHKTGRFHLPADLGNQPPADGRRI
jgi:hypothetical protein